MSRIPPAISMRAPDKNKGVVKPKRYLPIGNEVAKRACKRIIKVIMFVPIKTKNMYITVNLCKF